MTLYTIPQTKVWWS